MRNGLLASCSILLILLITLSFSLSEEKKVTRQVITVVDNETLINKSVINVPCNDDGICKKYYAYFENQTEQVSEQTYNKIKKGQKVTLTVHSKSLNWLSIFIISAIGFLCIIMFLCFTIETKYESGGEYYG